MFDTYVTCIGNVTTDPERRRITGDVPVVNFRLVSTSRRYDKATGRWVDGDSVFLKVACWRNLAEHVFASVFRGDPVIVTGRIYTRQYEHEGTRRWSYELDATAVGHDLSRGIARFERARPSIQPEVSPEPDVSKVLPDLPVEVEATSDGSDGTSGQRTRVREVA